MGAFLLQTLILLNIPDPQYIPHLPPGRLPGLTETFGLIVLPDSSFRVG
jgi:hypothetical protein